MIRTPLRAAALSLALTVGLSGCSTLGALNRASGPLDVYEIRPAASMPATRGRPQAIDFVIEAPTASGVLETDRILVRPSSAQVQYLPDARWSEPAPAMLRSAMVEGFERSGAFRYVGRSPLALSGNLVLVSNLSEFHAEIDPQADAGSVRMTLVARLVREDGAAVVASRTFSRELAVPDGATPTIIAAYEAVAQAVLSELARWVLTTRGVPYGTTS